MLDKVTPDTAGESPVRAALKEGFEKAVADHAAGKQKLTPQQRLDALRERQAELAKRIRAGEQKEANKKRRNETRAKVLIGIAIVNDIETDNDTAKASARRAELVALLDRFYPPSKDPKKPNLSRDFLIKQGWLT